MMNLTGIISISGKPGLYKVVAQAKNSVIVESLEDNKRVPAYATDRISALEDISIYTYGEDKPLKEIYTDIFNKENDINYIGQGIGYTQGLGVSYEVDFDTFSELVNKIFKKNKIGKTSKGSNDIQDSNLNPDYINFTNAKKEAEKDKKKPEKKEEKQENKNNNEGLIPDNDY